MVLQMDLVTVKLDMEHHQATLGQVVMAVMEGMAMALIHKLVDMPMAMVIVIHQLSVLPLLDLVQQLPDILVMELQ